MQILTGEVAPDGPASCAACRCEKASPGQRVSKVLEISLGQGGTTFHKNSVFKASGQPASFPVVFSGGRLRRPCCLQPGVCLSWLPNFQDSSGPLAERIHYLKVNYTLTVELC